MRQAFFCFFAVIALLAAGRQTHAQSFTLNVDYLYWFATQTNMSYGIIVNSDTLGDINDLSPIQQESSATSGFRLGATQCLACNWDIRAAWTHYDNSTSGSVSDQIVIANQLLAPNLNNIIVGGDGIGGPASGRWKLHFNMLDVDFGFFPFDACACSCCPFIGIKGGQINQRQCIRYQNFTDGTDAIDATVDMTNNFWGVGTRLGFNGCYPVGCGVNLVGTISLGALYGDHHSKNTSRLTISGAPFENKFNFLKCKLIPELELFIGLNWARCYCDHYLLSLAVGYETQYFWAAWRTQNSTIQNVYVTNAGFGDLMFHGLTIKFSGGY